MVNVEVYALLDGSIQALCKFHRESCNFLTTRQAKLEIKFGRLLQAIIFSGHKEDDFHEVKIFLEVVKKLHDDFEKLQDYSRLNQEAIQRLFTKIEKLSGSKSLLYQEQKAKWARSQIDLRTQCANFISQSEDLRSSVIERSSDGSRPSTVEDLVSKFKSDDLPSLVAQYAALYRAIRTDKPSSLAHPLNALLRDPSPEQGSNTFLYELAGLAVTCHSHLCFRYLLSETFSTNGVVLDHDLLNHVIIMEGELCLSHANDEFKKRIQAGEKRHAGLFDIAIEYLASRKEGVLSTQDTFGRLSLHYGALHGMDSICQSIMGYSHAWGLGSASRLILTPDWQGFTPFHYAVIENHVGVAKIFLETLFSEIKSGQAAQNETLLESLSDMLILAIRYKHDGIVFLLTKSSFDLHGFSLYGESALYVASQIGRSDYLSLLLEHSNAVHINTAEKVHGWNPLFIACVEGHHTIVELLLQAGASQDVYDHHGWTAKEHAALRGHLHIAEMLKPWDTGHLTGGPAEMPLKSKSAAMCRLSMSENHVIVNLGSLRNGKHVEAVNLRGSSPDTSPYPKNFTSMDMSISVEGASHRVKLPILSDMVNGPFVFPVTNPSEARLAFKLYAIDSSCETCELIGSAAYLLESDKDCFGANRESLVRERTVPILEKDTMDIIGTVTFTFVIAKPLMCSNTPPLVKQKLSAEGLQLVGHRGTNSIQSALHAAIYSNADTRKGLVKTLPVTVNFSWERIP
jgi:glycerophosphodiester phosphodiesterase